MSQGRAGGNRGGSLTLSCEVTGYPVPSVTPRRSRFGPRSQSGANTPVGSRPRTRHGLPLYGKTPSCSLRDSGGSPLTVEGSQGQGRPSRGHRTAGGHLDRGRQGVLRHARRVRRVRDQPAPRAPCRGDRRGQATRRLSWTPAQNRYGSDQAAAGHGPVADENRPRARGLTRHLLHRRQRGAGKPETFDFLGFTHYCTTTRGGHFRLGRKPVAKRVSRTLARIGEVLRKRWHHDIWEVGRWLGRVCDGWLNYFAVPGSHRFIRAFPCRLRRLWMRALRRRSQRARFSWRRLVRMTDILWPRVSIRHPWPNQRFAVNHPR